MEARATCSDPALAAADLALVPLWQSYRQGISPLEPARVKAEYFGRLKACHADRACIAAEQSSQQRFYRRALRSP